MGPRAAQVRMTQGLRPARPWLGRLALLCLALTGCRSLPPSSLPTSPEQALQSAQRWERAALVSGTAHAWTQCAGDAYLAASDARLLPAASRVAERCTRKYLEGVGRLPTRSEAEPVKAGGTNLLISTQGLSANLADKVNLHVAEGGEHSSAAAEWGVPIVLIGQRCADHPRCQLFPPEGIFRGATAWIEKHRQDQGLVRLVVAGDTPSSVMLGERTVPLRKDFDAAYSRGVRTSKLHRLGVWGLIGGREVGRRAGMYLLDDYDPTKRPLVMIHGLGSSPLIWEKLSNAVWSDPTLRQRYQIWHVVYQTDAPLLVQRRRVQQYLDAAWALLDPEGDDPARTHIVLIGHSLGGVIARMLCVDSGPGLWQAAFSAPLDSLDADASERALLDEIFYFQRYPGVKRAIFIASPHRGSPSATRWFGKLARAVIGRRNDEVATLLKVARRNENEIQPALKEAYLKGRINSISTLQESQPVRAAGQQLIPHPDVRFHTIAGSKSPDAASDGVVPVSSAELVGAQSTLIVRSGHNVHESPEAISEVIRILNQDSSTN